MTASGMYTVIEIGGALAPEMAAELLECLLDSRDWMTPTTGSETLGTFRTFEDRLEVTDPELPHGEFLFLEKFCRRHDLSYRRVVTEGHLDTVTEWSPELEEPRTYEADNDRGGHPCGEAVVIKAIKILQNRYADLEDRIKEALEILTQGVTEALDIPEFKVGGERVPEDV